MSADDLNGPEMTGPELEGDERLAAEYAMGLLEGEALLAARGRLSREPALAGMVARWERHLAPMLDDVGGAAPSDDLWSRIAGEVDADADDGEAGKVVALQRRVAMWQRVAAGSAVAAIARGRRGAAAGGVLTSDASPPSERLREFPLPLRGSHCSVC